MEIIGDANGKNAIIVDDFMISGGTIIDLAYKLREHGAKNIIACISHLLINDNGAKRLDESCIDILISTDSVHNPSANLSKKIKLVTAAPLFAEAVLRIHNNISISPLFNALPEKLIQLSE